MSIVSTNRRTRAGETTCLPRRKPLLVPVSPEEPHREIDQDIGPAPLPPVHRAEETDRRPFLPIALPDPDRMNLSLLPGQIRQWDSLEVPGVILLADLERSLDFIRREIAAAPDDVAVAPFLESPLRRGLLLRHPLSIMRLHILERSNAVALLPQPLDLFGADIRINGDAALGFLIADDDDPELGAQGGQVAAVASGDGDVEDGHAGKGGEW